MKKYLALLLLVSLPFLSFSQEYIDLFSINYGKTGKTTFENLPENTTITTFETDFTFPFVLNKKYVIITGGNHSSNSLQLFPEPNYNHLYSTLLKAGVKITHSEHWSGTYILLPKLASDYINLNKDDFYLGGAFVWEYKKTKNLNYSYGFYGSTEAFGLFITPIFGIYYLSPDSRLEMKLSLPIDGNLNYSLSNNTKIGFDYISRGSSYKLTQENIRSNYVQNNSLELSSYIERSLLDNTVLLRLKMGFSDNRFEVYPIDQKVDLTLSAFKFGDNRTQLNKDLSSSLFFKFENVYRFDLGSDKK